MAENSNISWTDATWNCWRGCTKWSDGCKFCYAETTSARNPSVLGEWGPDGKRVVAAESYWRLPLKWDREAEADGMRKKVFCLSLGDVLEDWKGGMVDTDGRLLSAGPQFDADSRGAAGAWWQPAKVGDGRPMLRLDHVRFRLFDTIRRTPNLDYLLLTKRPENFVPALGFAARTVFGDRHDDTIIWLTNWLAGVGRRGPPDNVWFGVSVENQPCADERIHELNKIPASVRFISFEPLLGPIVTTPNVHNLHGRVHWAIIGGESGHRRRECKVEWIDDLAGQLQDAMVATFVKQDSGPLPGKQGRIPDHLWNLKEFPQ